MRRRRLAGRAGRWKIPAAGFHRCAHVRIRAGRRPLFQHGSTASLQGLLSGRLALARAVRPARQGVRAGSRRPAALGGRRCRRSSARLSAPNVPLRAGARRLHPLFPAVGRILPQTHRRRGSRRCRPAPVPLRRHRPPRGVVRRTDGRRTLRRGDRSHAPQRALLSGTLRPGLPRAALLFVFSDATIAWNKFVEPLPDATLRIMSTYYAAQYLFALLALAASSRKAAAARP